MTLNQLATRHQALEKVDKSEFQRKARILQSLWREQQGLPIGHQSGPNGKRPLGSRLAMPDAQTNLWNFLSENIKRAVRGEVLDPVKSKGKLYKRPRIFDDLLSSQPLCFNLFAELRCNLDLATKVLRSVSKGRIHIVTKIEFEHSPGRGDVRYIGDKSAFDVFITFEMASGQPGFVGIEVKYHENLIGEAAAHRTRYDEVASSMCCFRQEALLRLKEQPLQQLWRDHLLAGILRQVGKFDDGFFLLIYPMQNLHCKAAADAYRECLTSSNSFVTLTLESLVSEIKKHANDEWADRLYDRYLNFAKIDDFLRLS